MTVVASVPTTQAFPAAMLMPGALCAAALPPEVYDRYVTWRRLRTDARLSDLKHAQYLLMLPAADDSLS